MRFGTYSDTNNNGTSNATPADTGSAKKPHYQTSFLSNPADITVAIFRPV